MSTFNRQPRTFSTPSKSDIKKYFENNYKFTGLCDDKNFLAVDQSTFSDCDNVYVDEDGLLKSRPSIKKINLQYGDILDKWTFENVEVYKTYYNNQFYLIFVQDDIVTQIVLNDVYHTLNEVPKIKPVLADRKIFIFNPYSFYYYDMDRQITVNNNIQYYYGDATPYIYIPTTKIFSNNIAQSDGESANELTTKERYSYLYDNITSALFNLQNQPVSVKFDDKTYSSILNNCTSKTLAEFSFTSNKEFDNILPLDNGEYIYYDINIIGTQIYDMELVTRRRNVPIVRLCIYYYKNDSTIETILDYTNTDYTNAILTIPKLSINKLFISYMRADGLYIRSVFGTGVYASWTNIFSNSDVQGTIGNNHTINDIIKGTVTDCPFINQNNCIDFTLTDSSTFTVAFAYDAYSTNSSETSNRILYKSWCVYQKISNVVSIKQKTLETDSEIHRQLYIYFDDYKHTEGDYTNIENCKYIYYDACKLNFNKTLTNNTANTAIYKTIFVCKQCNLISVGISNTDIYYRWLSIARSPVLVDADYDVTMYFCTNDYNSNLYVHFNKQFSKYSYVEVQCNNNAVLIKKSSITNNELNITCNLYMFNNKNNAPFTHTCIINNADVDIVSVNITDNYEIYLQNLHNNKVYVYEEGTNSQIQHIVSKEYNSLSTVYWNNDIGIGIYKTINYIQSGENVIEVELINKNSLYYKNSYSLPYVVDLDNNGEILYKYPEHEAELSQYYISVKNKIFITSTTYINKDSNKDFMWYFPKLNTYEMDQEVTNLHPISSSEVAIFTKDDLYYNTYNSDLGTYLYYKSKINLGCKEGSEICISYDGSYTIFASERGLVALTYQQFVSSTEQTVTYLSDNIYSIFKPYIENQSIKLTKFGYWLITYRQNSNKAFIFDFRTSSWWPVSLKYNIVKLLDVKEHLQLIVNNKLCSLSLLDSDYNDNIDNVPSKISWFLISQKLYLGAINYYKHIHNITLQSVHSTTTNYNTSSYKLQVRNYRKTIYGTIDTDKYQSINYKVTDAKTFVKNLNYFKTTEFQYKLENDDSEAISIPLSLSNICIKYSIGTEVR